MSTLVEKGIVGFIGAIGCFIICVIIAMVVAVVFFAKGCSHVTENGLKPTLEQVWEGTEDTNSVPETTNSISS